MTERRFYEPDCVFCQRVDNKQYIWESEGAVAFEPLNPVVPGHMLVVSKEHVPNFAWDSKVSADTMQLASFLGHQMGDCNLITSKGKSATQTVMHLHIHLVPRYENDGLLLPWSNQ